MEELSDHNRLVSGSSPDGPNLYIIGGLIMRQRVNYRIKKDLKENIKNSCKYKNLAYFVREAVRDFLKNPLSKKELHNINEKIENLDLKTTTVLLFDQDIENINHIKDSDETFQYDMIYLLSMAVYNYSEKEGLI